MIANVNTDSGVFFDYFILPKQSYFISAETAHNKNLFHPAQISVFPNILDLPVELLK